MSFIGSWIMGLGVGWFVAKPLMDSSAYFGLIPFCVGIIINWFEKKELA